MSNIRKSDVKDHLSPRFRKKVFVSQFEILPDATPSHREPAGAQSTAYDSMESALNLSPDYGRKPRASITPEIIND